MSKNKEFYVMIQGKKVIVSEEVYRAYVRPIRNEQRKERRDWKCRVMGEKGNLVRCNKKCSECKYAENGNKATGNILSLDKLLEKRRRNCGQAFNSRRSIYRKGKSDKHSRAST